MSQDITADALNMMMNALRAKKNNVVVPRHSKLLVNILALAKLRGYIKDFKISGNSLSIEFDRLNGCGAIKPRFFVKVSEIEKYALRYLPAKNLGMLTISTPKGLMAHTTCEEKNIGGSLLAYFY